MATSLVITTTLTHVWCPTCGTRYAIDADLERHAQEQASAFSLWCPAGHLWHYTGPSLEQRLREAERQLASARDDLRAERMSHTKTKTELRRQAKRSSAGVCPCCHRSFVQLARHMKTKHPDFGNDAA